MSAVKVGEVPPSATHVVTLYDASSQIIIQVWCAGDSTAQMEWGVCKGRVDRRGDHSYRATMVDLSTHAIQAYP